MGDKPSTADSTRHSHEDEVSSTVASSESTNIDVVNVLEVLIHLGDKLGAICVPIKQVLKQAVELRSNGIDPMIIMNDKDNKLLLQMIQEKLQGLLKDSKLNIIKKVIVQEAEQRLSVLLKHPDHHKLLGDLSLTQVACNCLNMDATATLSYICEVLQCQGHTHVPQEQLVDLYKSVKAEQLILERICHDNRATTTNNRTDYSESSGLQFFGDSVDPSHGSMFKVAFVGHEQLPTNFEFDGCEVRIYRAPGGTAKSFSNDPRMNTVLKWTHDLTILFLGSNDIHQNCEAMFIADKITQIADLIKGTCNSKIAITLIEPRKIHVSDLVTQELYDVVSKSINGKLERDMKEQFFINSTILYSGGGLQRVGKDWNDEGRTCVDNKFRDIISKFKHIHEVIQSVIGSGGNP